MAECSQQQDDSISLPIIERVVPSVAEAAMDEESEEKEEETYSSEEAADHAMPMRKIRPTSSNDNAMGGENDTVGAIQINERAPQINRRFFMGLDRPGARQRRTEDRAARRAAARRGSGSTTPAEDQNNSNTGGQAAETLEVSRNTLLTTSSNRHEEMNDSVESAVQSSFITRRISFSFNRRVTRQDSTMLIEATLVEDSEIYEAKTMGFCQRYWMFIFAITVVILTTSTLVGLFIEPPFTKAPKTSPPTLSPTFDPRPTLDIVQERGYLLCGVNLITQFQFINIVSYNSEFWRCCVICCRSSSFSFLFVRITLSAHQ